MKNIFIISISIAFIITASGSFSLSSDEAVQNFKSRMFGINTMEGNINITYSTGMISAGSFKFMAPGKFYIKFSNPSGKIIATNGKKLWVYDPSSTICGVQDVDNKGLSGGIASMLNGYNGIASQGASDTTIKLKGHGKGYSEIVLQVDKSYLLKRATFKDEKGEGFAVSLSNLRVNENINAGVFDFSVPSNAQLIKDPLNIR